jgi:hypothetical protein
MDGSGITYKEIINSYRILVGRHHLENLNVDGRIILKRILNKWVWGCRLITISQDREQKRAPVNVIMKLPTPWIRVPEKLIAAQLVMKFSAFYEARRFVIVFKKRLKLRIP